MDVGFTQRARVRVQYGILSPFTKNMLENFTDVSKED